MGRPTARRRLTATFGFAAVVLLTGSGGSCSEERHEPTVPTGIEPAQLGQPDLRLLVLTDLDGYLEPCGCTSRPLGGIDRMSAAVAELRAEGVPTVMVAAGDLLFHGAAHAGDADRAAAQDRMSAETLVEILGRIGLDAAAPGPRDFAHGAGAFEALTRDAGFPILAAGTRLAPASAVDEAGGDEETAQNGTPQNGTPQNGTPQNGTPQDTPQDTPQARASTDEPILLATALRPAGDLQVGIVGLSDLRTPAGALPDRVEAPDELVDVGRAAVRELRASGADVIVALVNGDRRAARRIATGVDGVDFIVHGGLDQADVSPPSMAGGAVIVNAGRHGQGLVVLDVHRRDGDAWSDASVWTREVARAHLDEQIEDLRARIAEWEADPDVAAADVERQRGRLHRLEADERALLEAPTVEGSAFTARYRELAPEVERDGAISALMGRLDRRVNEHNRVAFADWTPEPAPEGQPHYVGSQACASCHGAATRWWRGTPHGRAYATLEDRHKNFNLGCVGCHVTGYLEPGGATMTHVENLEDVGCENCHGPGSMHVAAPTEAAVNVQRDPPERVCLDCHTPEHSDTFDFDAYRRLLIAPGHGQPLGGGGE